MKIWGNNLKVGDTIYYEYDFEIRQSTVKEKDTKSFRMPSLIMENGNRIFVNSYYYTEKQEVIDNLIDELKNRCVNKLNDIKKEQELLKYREVIINDKLNKLNNFKNDNQKNVKNTSSEYYEDMRIECYDCHTVVNFHEDDIVDGYYVICPRCGEHLVILP